MAGVVMMMTMGMLEHLADTRGSGHSHGFRGIYRSGDWLEAMVQKERRLPKIMQL